jgi:hypothetical protein
MFDGLPQWVRPAAKPVMYAQLKSPRTDSPLPVILLPLVDKAITSHGT